MDYDREIWTLKQQIEALSNRLRLLEGVGKDIGSTTSAVSTLILEDPKRRGSKAKVSYDASTGALRFETVR